jgi:multidrug resistance efflux pump
MRQFLFLFCILLFGCENESEKIKARQGSITESVYASVTIQPDSLYQVHAAVGGILDQVFVEEGDVVKEGDRILQIKNETPELNVENARLGLELARKEYQGSTAILLKIQQEIDMARLNLRQDSVDFYRQKNLWENNIGTESEFDRKKLAYEISQKNLERLQNEYNRTSLQLETQLKQARNTYETTRLAAGDYLITSVMNGRVYSLFKEPGESVTFQEPVATIGSKSHFIIHMLIDEVDIGRVSVGQEVLLTLDAFGDRVFRGRITRILPQKDERTQTFSVEAEFLEPPPSLYAGLSGEANIVIKHKPDALIIPRHYLIDENKVQTENELVEVVTGLKSMEEIEILSGIDSSTYIVKPE